MKKYNLKVAKGVQPRSELPAGGDRPLLCDHPGEPLLVSGLEAQLDLERHQVPLEENWDAGAHLRLSTSFTELGSALPPTG